MINGTEKSALLLMSIGSEQAAKILRHLTPFEIQELLSTMVADKNYSKNTLKKTLCECYDIATKQSTFDYNNDNNYLDQMLTQSLGEQKGKSLLKNVLEIRNFQLCINLLNRISAHKVSDLLDKEPIQIITIILICLNSDHATNVLSYLNHEKRAEVILRIIEFKGVEESTLSDLIKVINNLLQHKKVILSDKGGLQTAVKILNSMTCKDERVVLNTISKLNKSLAEKIIKEMFAFKNIIDIDDKYIKLIIKNIEKEKLYIALQKTNDVIRQKFFQNMSSKDSEQLRYNLEKISYISDNSIKNEQKLILIMLKNFKNYDANLLNRLNESHE